MRREAPPPVIVALLPPACSIAQAQPTTDPAPVLHLASEEERRHVQAIGFSVVLAFAAPPALSPICAAQAYPRSIRSGVGEG
jgi:hypothetical protein